MPACSRIRRSSLRFAFASFALVVTLLALPNISSGQEMVCPNDNYPAATIYPQIIFNAHTGKLYWFDPSYKGHKYTPLQSTTFVPPTSIRERVYVQVCGLHFASQVTTTPNVQAISDAEPELYTGPSPTAIAPSIPPPGENQEPEEAAPPKPSPPSQNCDTIGEKVSMDSNDLEQKIKAFDSAVIDYNDTLESHAFTMIDSGPLSIANLESQIGEITQRAKQVGNSVTLFNAVMVDTQNASASATALAASFAAASAQKQWSSVLSAGNDLNKSALTYEQDRNQAISACTNLKGQVEQTDNHLATAKKKQKDTYAPVKNLFKGFNDLSDGLDRLFEADNEAYASSSVSSLSLLTVPTGNSVVTLTISVKDTFTPFTIAKSTPSPFDNTTGSPAPITTSIKIDRTTKNVTSISIQAPAAAAAAVTLPDNPSATSQAANIQITAAAPSSASTAATSSATTPAPVSTAATASATSTTAASGTTAAASPGAATTTTPTSPGSTTVAAGSTPTPDATVIMERHQIVHFVATGGLLVQTAHAPDYSVETVPTAIVTTTTTTVTPAGSTMPLSPTISVVQSTGTDNFAFLADNPNLHFGALIGVTWFPGGIDTFGDLSLRKNGKMRMTDFDFSPRNFGLFVGTTVNTAGIFAIAPVYQISPGIELYAGVSNFSRTQLTQGVVPCASLGTGSTTSVTQTLPNQQDAAGNVTATTITTATTSSCNTAAATPLNSSTAAPTGSTTQFAPAFGILLNTNLFAALGLTL